uniref:Uncharacterized protein n=1 Tax=Vitis vinifera TaxID=29760 RepID=A5B140_VITVI|nr:hypothetical protein VITISV_000969 [Vitis vinifera]
MGFHFTIDINSKLSWCLFISSRKYREASGEHRGTVQKNISKCQSHIFGSFRRTPRHCAKWLRNSPGKRYQRIRIRLTGEVETPSSPIRVEFRRSRISDVRHPGGMSAEQLHPDSLRGYVARSPIRTPLGRSTRHSRSSHLDDSISYPDMLSG